MIIIIAGGIGDIQLPPAIIFNRRISVVPIFEQRLFLSTLVFFLMQIHPELCLLFHCEICLLGSVAGYDHNGD